MRNKFTILFMTLVMMIVCGTATAQPRPDKKQRMSREQLAEMQAKHIAEELKFGDDVTVKFVQTFMACQKEVWALCPPPKKQKPDMSDAEMEKNIKERFAQSEKLLAIRQKYYKKYSKFLTQKQIQQVYDKEKEMMERFARHHHGKKHPRPQEK